ncbi:MAG: hypothetical protein K0S58_2532 [Nitrospira sp.]|jgi:hypothetical protein|nr:hypothetical protein [Nitrospira sp.]
MQSNEADELTGCVLLNRPEPPAPFVYELPDSLGKCVTLLSEPSRRVVTHDIRVSTHRCERLKIRLTPLSEPKARCEEFSRMVHAVQMYNVQVKPLVMAFLWPIALNGFKATSMSLRFA